MNNNRRILIFPWLIFSILICSVQIEAEINSKDYDFADYNGVWLTEINNEYVYLLIKSNNIARYFYKDRIDNNVYKASWKMTESNLLYVSTLDYGSLYFRLEDDLRGTNYDDSNLHVSTLLKVSEETLGSWARPADYSIPKNNYTPSTYFGVWETKDEKNSRLIKVFDNRNVISLSKGGQDAKSSLQGEWYKHGKQLHIAWENGSYSIIDNQNKSIVKLYEYNPGTPIVEKMTNYTVIAQIKNESNEGYRLFEQLSTIQKNNISLSHFDNKSLLKFYRGDWIIIDENYQHAQDIMKLNRFGGISLESDKKNKGNWYLSGGGCLINLEAGIRMKLKHIGSAFILFVYESTRPLDGYPNKILRTAPMNRDKLDSLNPDIYFTNKLMARIDKIKLEGGKNIPLISDLSDQNKIKPPINSPWWWPIWSDNPKIKEAETFSKNKVVPTLTNTVDSVASNKANDEKLTSTTVLRNKTKWEWPF